MNEVDVEREEDVAALHKAVLRERQEPVEGREPVPIWMGALFVLLIGWGGWYLGRHDAQFDGQRADMQPLISVRGLVASDGEPPAATGDAARIEQGAQLYAGRCVACHQSNGKGLPGLAPTLDGSEWVTGDPTTITRVVLHGLSGPIEVAGEPWNGAMPAWGGSMTDDEISAVISYVRAAWSNDADPVTTEQVKKVRDTDDRSTPWTAPEL